MLTSMERGYRTAQLSPECKQVLDAIMFQPGTLMDLCKSVGRTQCRMEQLLATLVDRGLATRSNGSRVYAVFRAA